MNDKTKTVNSLDLNHPSSSQPDPMLEIPEKKILTPAEIARNSMNSNLKLDQKSVKPSRTRNELYNELSKNDKKMEEEDYYEFAAPVNRGIAFGIDSAFIYFLVTIFIAAAPTQAKLWHQIFLDKYKLQFMFGENAMINVIMYSSIFLALFLLIVIPVAFFNVSLGKKMMNLRVRGDNKYTLSISQVFKRELIYKPIGAACIVGFILPFFDKKKKSLHDKLVGTFVIKE